VRARYYSGVEHFAKRLEQMRVRPLKVGLFGSFQHEQLRCGLRSVCDRRISQSSRALTLCMTHRSEGMRIPALRAIELSAQTDLIVLGLGGQAMHNNLTSVSVGIALTAGAIYHIAVLVALAVVLP
jgi:hypothetical protein